jgi:hypothetical protein
MQANDGESRGFADVALDVAKTVKEQVDIEGRVDRNPYASIAAAIGIGYALGGGVFTPLTARALGHGLRLGLRLVVMPIVAEQLLELARGAVAADPTPAPTHPRSRNGGASVEVGVRIP